MGDKKISQGMTMMIIAMLMLPGLDAIAKWLAGSISPGQVAFSRFLFQVIFMSPLLLRTSGPWLSPTLGLHALRGGFIALATVLFFTGLSYLPIADAIAIFFIEPLIVTLLSALFLKEHVGWRRLSAIIIGFIGALIIIRPTFADVGWPVLYPVGTAFCFAIYFLLTRKLVAKEDPIRLQFFAGIFGFLVMGVALIFGTKYEFDILVAVLPSHSEWALLGLLGIIATIGHLLVVLACQRAPVGVLAPFQYIEIIGATALGWIFFKDFPDPLTWLGISIIVSSGIFIFYRESQLSKATASALDTTRG